MVHHHQQFAQGRVPLPPVPELDRSDHERESISPIPEQRNMRPILPKPKALPSPLVTPIQPAERHLPKPRRIPSRSAELPMPPVAQNRSTIQDRNFYGRNGPALHQVTLQNICRTNSSDEQVKTLCHSSSTGLLCLDICWLIRRSLQAEWRLILVNTTCEIDENRIGCKS